MNEKVTLQAISDIFSSQYGISKKTTDAFGKSFFDTIVDGLNNDGVVKIKGLGTFKIVDVSSRESVNVTNGERIVIDGYRKVAFTPDELAEQKKEELIREVENAVTEATAQSEEEIKAQLDAELKDTDKKAKDEVETIVFNFDKEPQNVETPKDELSGIDMLISTPESIQEVKKDVELARVRAEQTLEEAKAANIEYRRLQLLLERLEANQAPEALIKEMAKASVAAAATPSEADEPITEEIAPAADNNAEGTAVPGVAPAIEVEEPAGQAEEPADDTKPASLASVEAPKEDEKPASANPSHEEALKRYLSDDEEEDDDDDDDSPNRSRLWILLGIIVIALAAIAFYLYQNSRPGITYDMSEVEEMTKPVFYDTDSSAVADAYGTDTTVAEPGKADIAQASAPVPDPEMNKDNDNAKDAEKVAADKKDADAKAKAEADKKKLEADKKKAEADKKKAEADKKKAEADKKKAEADKKKADAKKSTGHGTHKIAVGETLSSISKKYYGTQDSVRAIIRANNFKNPNNITVGTVVKLP